MPGKDEVCDRLCVTYRFDLSANAVLQRKTEGLWSMRRGFVSRVGAAGLLFGFAIR
jgi:hypothetical protein